MAVADRGGARWWQAPARALVLWHLCSLDAPTVAVTWAWAVGHAAAAGVRGADLLLLALGTWIVYVLDRLLDASLAAEDDGLLRERHYFHQQHRRLLLWLCGAGAAGVAALCCLVQARLVAAYLLLAVPVGLYAASVHGGLLQRSSVPVKPLAGPAKEAAVAILFTAAVLAPPLVAALPASRARLLPLGVLLVLVAWLNCACIRLAEWPGRRAAGPRSDRPHLQAASPWLPLSPVALLLALCAAAYGASRWNRPEAAVAACLALTAMLLRMLIRDSSGDGHVPALWVRVLSDLALLTPLLLLVPAPL